MKQNNAPSPYALSRRCTGCIKCHRVRYVCTCAADMGEDSSAYAPKTAAWKVPTYSMLHKAAVGVIAILTCITVVQHVMSRIQPPASQYTLKHSLEPEFQSTVSQQISLRHLSQSESQTPAPQIQESDMPQPVIQGSAVISKSIAPFTEEDDLRISSLNSTYEAPSRERALSPQFPAIMTPYVHPPYEPPL